MTVRERIEVVVVMGLMFVGAFTVLLWIVFTAFDYIDSQKTPYFPRDNTAATEISFTTDGGIVIDGNNSIIIYESGGGPCISITGDAVNSTIKNFTFMGYDNTIDGRWSITKVALRKIWTGVLPLREGK